MAHRSYLSPDGKWVLVAEMDNKGWLPCRLVSFEHMSAGEQVGPAPSRCTNAAWSPDGAWMYFTADAGSGFHIYRQRFPRGSTEQLTFGGSEEEGLSLSSDGKSLLTSIGVQQSTVWFHNPSGDHQISSEGYAYTPLLSGDGKKIYYLSRSVSSSRSFVTGELWRSDIDGNNRERLFPGLDITRYDVSSDGQRIVFAANQADGKSLVWLAWLDHRSAPRQLAQREAYRPLFGPADWIYFLANENNAEYIFRVKPDGSERQKVIPDPVIYILNTSPDGQWIVAWVADAEGDVSVVGYPLAGGSARIICRGCWTSGPSNPGPPLVSWSHDQRTLYFRSILPGRDLKKTFVIPLPRGQVFPELPEKGLTSDDQWATVAGVRELSGAGVFPGPDSSTYAFTRAATQRNIFRIQLP